MLTKNTEMEENLIATKVIGCAITVHRELGPGLLESSYEECLFYELRQEGFFVEKQKGLPLVYKEVNLEIGYRIDMLINKKLVLEIKSVDILNEVHVAQVLTYMKLSGCRLGLLMNFNVVKLKDGIKRLIL
jgi:GxxExxY protein